MLQQTRVDTVIPYFHRWMERFPDIQALAKADEEDVLSEWQGLGYYRRARFLRSAAQEIVERFGGQLPSTRSELKSLPGIGAYTSGAIASLAFGQSEPAVDGNVLRVTSRLFANEADISRQKTKTEYEEALRHLIPADAPAAFNEAMIELGATVCTSSSPACQLCPVEEFCEGKALGVHTSLPIKKSRTRVRDETLHAWIVQDDNKFLLAQRPSDSLLGGLWEFPLRKVPPKEAITVSSESDSPEKVFHIFSHIRRTIVLHILAPAQPGAQQKNQLLHVYADHHWVSMDELEEFPRSTMMNKMIRAFCQWSGIQTET